MVSFSEPQPISPRIRRPERTLSPGARGARGATRINRESMFVIILTYVKPIRVVEQHLEAHRQFLREHFEAGRFIASGRRVPRTGGVILAEASSKQVLEEVMAGAPFVQLGIAEYEVIEFSPTMYDPEMVPVIRKRRAKIHVPSLWDPVGAG